MTRRPRPLAALQRAVPLFILSGALATAGDQLHVRTGTLAPLKLHRSILGVPVHLPLLFGTAGLLLSAAHAIGDALARGRPRRETSPATTPLAAGTFLALYAASAYLPRKPGARKTTLLGAGAVLSWAAFDRSRAGALAGALAAVAGPAVEIALVQSGRFRYNESERHLLGVPAWLPALYVAGAVGVGSLRRHLLARPCSGPA